MACKFCKTSGKVTRAIAQKAEAMGQKQRYIVRVIANERGGTYAGRIDDSISEWAAYRKNC